MNKYWVYSESFDWADEFDVYFFDIFTDTEKNNINWIGERFPGLKIDYCFGTNEWWDPEEGFSFYIEGMPATEEEANTLRKFQIQGESLRKAFDDWVFDHLDGDTRNHWSKQYKSFLNVPEEIFQAYPFELNEYDYTE